MSSSAFFHFVLLLHHVFFGFFLLIFHGKLDSLLQQGHALFGVLLLQRHFLLFDFHLDLHIKLLLLLSGLCGQVIALMFHLGLQDGHPLFQLFIQHFVVAVFLLGNSSRVRHAARKGHGGLRRHVPSWGHGLSRNRDSTRHYCVFTKKKTKEKK